MSRSLRSAPLLLALLACSGPEPEPAPAPTLDPTATGGRTPVEAASDADAVLVPTEAEADALANESISAENADAALAELAEEIEGGD